MKFRRCFFFFTLISVLGAPVLADESAHPTPGLHARITQAQVFPKPLTWVGDHAPTEAENQALWTAIERYQQTPRLSVWEDYLARNLRSPWTPCLQSFVAADCWSQGRITPALEYWAKAWEATRL